MSGATALLHVDDALANEILHAWRWLLQKPYTIIGLSRFGDVFLKDPQGLIDMLDLVRGEVHQVAWCIEEFEHDLQSEAVKAERLMDGLASHLAATGVPLEQGQCYAFREPPILGGQLQPENFVPLDIRTYLVGLSQALP
jgi:hypothetical protein